ncbi:MAG: winged helix-turn-helix domain-containing protein [Chloroflexota bacterium]
MRFAFHNRAATLGVVRRGGYTDAMRVRFKVWIEKDDELVLSDWRARLLESIAETGSLSEAAGRLGVHYRIAWGKVRQMEQRLGVKLVEAHAGGAGGGGAKLTAAGQDLVRRYRAASADVATEVEKRFQDLFPTEG